MIRVPRVGWCDQTASCIGLIVAMLNWCILTDLLSNNLERRVPIMDVAKIILQHKKLGRLISTRRIKQGLDVLADMIKSSSSGDFRDELEDIVMTYKNILTYTIDGIEDPERKNVYNNLIRKIFTLADRVKQDILSRNSGWHIYWVKQQLEKELRLTGKTIIENVDDLMFKSELDEWLKVSRETIQHREWDSNERHHKLIRNIFNHLWLTDNYGEAESSLIDIFKNKGSFTWYEKCLFTTAVTLSTLRTWQKEKIIILTEIYGTGDEKVMERALSGLIFALHYHNDRLAVYPEVIQKLSELSLDPAFREHCRIVVLQTIRSRETEKLGKKLHDEILPKVEKLKPFLDEKLDLENILPKYKSNEKNPDWSHMFSESEDIFKTMEELTRLQMDGADVYMSAFSNMKHFDFFKDFQNWFIPFYPDHETVDEIFEDEILGPGTNELAEALYKTPFICNSDKYSLLLNLKHLPAAQKKMMLKVFRTELEGLQQLNEEEASADPYRNFRINVIQYIQDVYRFFKLSPYKKEFEDIFSGKLDIYNSEFFKITFNGTDTEAGIADYFFSRNFYDDALELYLKVLTGKVDEAQIYEKIAYCYQEKYDYENALAYYQKAELIDRKAWTIKKTGLCLRRLGRIGEALEYYLQASDLEPENMHTVLMIGHCYLDLKNYEEALKYYFRIEFSDPQNIRILKPIAYCYFALGKFEESEKYYERLARNKLNAHDQINRGHLALCTGNKREAINYYRQSILGGELTIEQFLTIFNQDSALLLKLGMNPDDLHIISDYLLFISG